MAVSNRRSGSYFWTRICEGADHYQEMCEMRSQMESGVFDLSLEEEMTLRTEHASSHHSNDNSSVYSRTSSYSAALSPAASHSQASRPRTTSKRGAARRSR